MANFQTGATRENLAARSHERLHVLRHHELLRVDAVAFNAVDEKKRADGVALLEGERLPSESERPPGRAKGRTDAAA
jgi:hypothetical protein